jgi:carbon storage regulator CsrA
MLVLTRCKGERVVIDGPCIVTLLEIQSGGKCRLGFEADPSVTIHREEIVKRIEREGGGMRQ